MAECFYAAMLSSTIIGTSPRKIRIPDIGAQYPLTQVDTLSGTYEIRILKERWPFYEKIKTDTAHRTIPEALAGALVVKQLSWDRAMEKLYQYYHQKNDFQNTLRVAEAVIMEHPYEASFYAKAGSICLRLKDFEKGTVYFRKAYKYKSSPAYARFATLCLIHRNRLVQSLEFLTDAAKNNRVDRTTLRLLAVIQNIMALENTNIHLLNQLAGSYYFIGLEDKARTLVDRIPAIEPSNKSSLKLLQQMDRSSK